MRVVIVHNRRQTRSAADELRVIEKDVAELRADGVEVYCYMRDSEEASQWTLLGRASMAFRPVLSPADAVAFRHVLRRVRPDIVHLHNPFPIISPWIVRTAKAHRVPVVQTVHDYTQTCIRGTHIRNGRTCTECVGKRLPWPAVQHGCYERSAVRAVPVAAAVRIHKQTWNLIDQFLPIDTSLAEYLNKLGIPDFRIDNFYIRRRDESSLKECYRRATSLPRGSLAIVGPDGVGKSTIVGGLLSLGKASHVRVEAAHFRPGVAVRSRVQDQKTVVNPHSQVSRPVAPALARTALVFGDFLAGWLGPWRRAASRGLLVLERPWLDQLVDPIRYRLPEAIVPLIDVLAWLLPRADTAILLSGQPQEIYRRKPEIAVGEVRRQLNDWMRLLRRVGRRSAVVDSVAAPIESTMQHLIAAASADRKDAVNDSWILPLGFPRRVDMHATSRPLVAPALLSVYPPQRRLVATTVRLGQSLARIGLASRGQPPDIPLAAIAQRLGASLDGAVAMRSSAPGRWIVGLEVLGEFTYLIKVGSETDIGLLNEALILGLLKPGDAWVAPELVLSDVIHGRRVLATRGVLSAQPARSVPLHEIADISFELSGGCAVGLSIVHGDLAPWNVRRAPDGRLVVLDWECARLEERPMWDLVHYVVQQGILIGRPEPSSAVRAIERAVRRCRSAAHIHEPQVMRAIRQYLDEAPMQSHPRAEPYRVTMRDLVE